MSLEKLLQDILGGPGHAVDAVIGLTLGTIVAVGVPLIYLFSTGVFI